MFDFRRPAGRAGASTPLVALETAVLTHGLPRPQNRQALASMMAAVRDAGAEPLAVGVLEGRLVVGLSEAELDALAADEGAGKAGARDLARFQALGGNAGTTVSATLVACRLSDIPVFATGGIGGVHRGWQQHRDVSADLGELARTACCVVCSGAKSVLDLPATLESLETLGVPVCGWGTERFPRFFSPGGEDLPVPRLDDPAHVARLCRHRWQDLEQTGGVLLANPAPAHAALDPARLDPVIEAAVSEAERQGIAGAALTPFLLDAVARATGGDSLLCNLALLEDNAAVAGRLAVAMTELT